MQVKPTSLPDSCIITPRVLKDDRGYFFESFQEEKMREAIPTMPTWVQDNESMSKRGVLRGLHFQTGMHAQAKLVRVTKGLVQDIAVDLRKGSPTYGQWESVILSGENKLQFYVPAGFAHGFLVLEDDTIFSYKCSNYYHAESEGSILWNDPDLAIRWEINKPILSAKDQIAPRLRDIDLDFVY